MALLPLVFYSYHPALHHAAEPVTQFDGALAELIENMYETMYHEQGVGLAAPQVGIAKRIATIDVTEDRSHRFCIINPEIIEREGEELMQAGCLSIPGVPSGKVPRARKVKVRAQDVNGKFFEIEGADLLAHCLQHEIDHLNGKLFIDYFSPMKKRMALKKMEKFLKREK
ncbi:MAG: peptide deformylase [Gammaproteobacteria bacterium]|nr:peptide deformylase [Gammaproteobacteria bacterium]